jgi:predicted CXXCH cytochrome family protein
MRATRSIIVGAVAALGLALPASAQIASSAHDFSGATWKSDGNQICSPCHTPHASDTTVATAPLWNHELTTGFSYDMNDGGGTITERTLTAGFDDKTILCLSCHDGTVAVDSFGGAAGSTYMSTIGTAPNSPGYANIAEGTSGSVAGTDVLDMSNDHPVGIGAVYPGTSPYPAISPYPLFTVGVTTDTLGCVTCHEVHNDSGNLSLLRDTIDSSTLCQNCHNR